MVRWGHLKFVHEPK